MIFVTDKGRLCNNIIQYGHLYAWGRDHDRRTMSMRFAHKYPEFHISHTAWHNSLVYIAAKLAAKCRLIPTVHFNDLDSDYVNEQEMMLTRRNVLAIGWCVRFYDLFDKYKDEITSLFAFTDKIEDKVSKILPEKSDDRLRLGVHIRRGDYATWCGGHYYFDDIQYASVIEQFLKLFPGKEVDIYICGNDPQLQRGFFTERFGKDHVHFPDGSPAEDLCLLSHCDYLTGPPSTFTLVASMYHNALLYWMADAAKVLEPASFQPFEVMTRLFDSYYIPAT